MARRRQLPPFEDCPQRGRRRNNAATMRKATDFGRTADQLGLVACTLSPAIITTVADIASAPWATTEKKGRRCQTTTPTGPQPRRAFASARQDGTRPAGAVPARHARCLAARHSCAGVAANASTHAPLAAGWRPRRPCSRLSTPPLDRFTAPRRHAIPPREAGDLAQRLLPPLAKPAGPPSAPLPLSTPLQDDQMAKLSAADLQRKHLPTTEQAAQGANRRLPTPRSSPSATRCSRQSVFLSIACFTFGRTVHGAGKRSKRHRRP